MKLGNLLLVVTLATAGLLGSSKTYAQAFQSGDIIMGDYYWYHSDGTFVGNLSYGLCGGGCFVGPGPFDLQGNHYETWDTQPTQQIYVQKYDANGNFVKTVRPPGQYPEGGGPLGLNAKGDIFWTTGGTPPNTSMNWSSMTKMGRFSSGGIPIRASQTSTYRETRKQCSWPDRILAWPR